MFRALTFSLNSSIEKTSRKVYHLSFGRSRPRVKAQVVAVKSIFNYILKLLYLGCQWKELPIEVRIQVEV